MSTVVVPSREELLRRVAEIAPVLRANATWSAENRRLHEETVQALTDAGLFRMRLPRHHGGFESDAQTLVEVLTEVARADGSAGWVLSSSWIAGWGIGLFPDEVQEEVFADPDARICATIGPGTAIAVPVPGGVLVNGSWPFISGALHSTWQQTAAIFLDPEGQPYPIMAPVRLSELEIVDDWHTHGLRGTGSVTTVAKDLFIPQERILPAPAVLAGQSASKLNADSPMYRAPFIVTGAATTVAVCVGMALGVQDTFMQRLPGRKITYTEYPSQADAPITHLRVAEAALKIDEAQFHARRLAALVDAKCATGEPWEMTERARSRADEGAAARLTLEAAQLLATASGGSAAYTGVPIQRIVNDLQTFNLHAMMNPDVNAETYGRVLCGLEPNTYYI